MTANLKTNEIIEAALDLIKAGTFTTAPLIVQEGDLGFYVENITSMGSDLPAILVTAVEIGLDFDGDSDISAIGGQMVGTETTLRCVLIDKWDESTSVVDVRTTAAQELAEIFIRSSGQLYNMNEAISGYTIFNAVPTSIELAPPEHDLVSQTEGRPLYAVAVNVRVTGQSLRS